MDVLHIYVQCLMISMIQCSDKIPISGPVTVIHGGNRPFRFGDVVTHDCIVVGADVSLHWICLMPPERENTLREGNKLIKQIHIRLNKTIEYYDCVCHAYYPASDEAKVKISVPIMLESLMTLDATPAAPRVTTQGLSPPAVNCPRFPTRYEQDTLVVEIQKGECEMLISSINIYTENADKVKSFRKRVKSILRKVNVPTVSFRPLLTISELVAKADQTTVKNKVIPEKPTQTGPSFGNRRNDEVPKSCTSTGYRFVGPVLVIDTVPGECQMMIVAQVGKNHKKLLRRPNKKGKPRKLRKKIMFEYIDEPFL